MLLALQVQLSFSLLAERAAADGHAGCAGDASSWDPELLRDPAAGYSHQSDVYAGVAEHACQQRVWHALSSGLRDSRCAQVGRP